jgi:energy-coupling factor transport system permease protein
MLKANVPVPSQKNRPFIQLDSRARLFFCLMLVIGFLAARNLLQLGVLFIPLIAAIVLAYPDFKRLLRNILVPMPFLLFLAVLQVFFNANTAVAPVLFQIGKNIVTPEDIMNGVMLLVRFTGMVGAISLAAFTLKPSETARAFENMISPLMKLKIPTQDLALMVLVTLRFIPLLQQTSLRIARAQTARGADWGGRGGGIGTSVRRVIPIIIPLFVNALKRSEHLAAAMQSRGYSSTLRRTSLTPMRFKAIDGWILILLLLSVSGILIFL